MVERQLPQAMIDSPNPVFERELRHVGWFRDKHTIQRFSLVAFFIYAVLLCMMFLTRGVLDKIPFRADRFFGLRSLPEFALGLTIAADVYYIFSAINHMSCEVESGGWELLRLTPIREQDILDAKYSIAQLCSWPIMTLDRVFQLLPLLPLALFRPISRPDLLLLYVIPIVVAGLLTPVWRMRAMTAVGLSIPARRHNTVYALLIGVGAVLLLHIGLYVITYVIAINSLQGVLGPTGIRNYDSYLWLSLWAGVLSLVFTYYWCRAIQTQALRYALWNAFRPD